MLVIPHNDMRPDLIAAWHVYGRGLLVLVNLDAGRGRLLAMAELLLAPEQRDELAALLPADRPPDEHRPVELRVAAVAGELRPPTDYDHPAN